MDGGGLLPLLGHWEETHALLLPSEREHCPLRPTVRTPNSESCILDASLWEADVSPLSCLTDMSGRPV